MSATLWSLSVASPGATDTVAGFLEAADELLAAGGLLKATIEDVERVKAKERVRHPAWFRDYARLEREAVEANDYRCQGILGLF